MPADTLTTQTVPEAALHAAPVPDVAPTATVEASAVAETIVEHVPAQPPGQLPVGPPLDAVALDRLFRSARTHYRWADVPVADEELRTLYDLLKMGPTSANCSPARFLFLRTSYAKERLRPALSAGNLPALSAPVVCIVAHDPAFFAHLPRLYPDADVRAWFQDNARLADETSFRNGTLQGAYLLLAARAVGLDIGPMSGFDADKVDAEFMPAHGWKSNFLVALGHAEPGEPHPRAPRLSFEEACVLL